MRKSREDAAQTRLRIIEAASHEFRRNGFDGTGLTDLMAAAGLTHGGFYKHFSSKDEVAVEACTRAIADVPAVVEQRTAMQAGRPLNLNRAIKNYLSSKHLSNVSQGCPFAALGSELSRGSPEVREAATVGLKGVVDALAKEGLAGGDNDAWSRALGVATSMIGALTMARMVDDPKLASQILSEARSRLST